MGNKDFAKELTDSVVGQIDQKYHKGLASVHLILLWREVFIFSLAHVN